MARSSRDLFKLSAVCDESVGERATHTRLIEIYDFQTATAAQTPSTELQARYTRTNKW